MLRYISSFYEGRCRIRHSALKNEETLANVEGFLCNVDGVTAVTTNPRVGSLLLEYDTEILPTDSLMQMAQPLVESFFGSPEQADDKTSTKINDTAAKYIDNAQEMGANLLKQGQCLTQSVDKVLKKNVTRKTINYAMLASLGLSVGLSFTGSKNAHVITGGVFLAGLGMHLMRNRKAL